MLWAMHRSIERQQQVYTQSHLETTSFHENELTVRDPDQTRYGMEWKTWQFAFASVQGDIEMLEDCVHPIEGSSHWGQYKELDAMIA